MERILLISARPEDRRKALLEDGRLYEFHWDDPTGRGVTGNIYLGRVQRALQGLGAAFVDIGLDRPGYLNIEEKRQVPDEGAQILVQVMREPSINKGAKLSDHITVAGQYVAVEPGSQGIGISRKIHATPERRRLREIMQEAPDNYRVTARTAAEGRTRQEIMREMEFLQGLWAQIQAKSAGLHAPALVFQAGDILMSAAQDLVTLGCRRLVLENEEDYDKVLRLVDSMAPDYNQYVELYRGPEPLFARWKLINEITRIPQRIVNLTGGGSLVFDRTEALTAIDVNTGSHLPPGDREDAFFRTNMAAIPEIARQIRLRNIGGLIVIDLVTMNRPQHNEEVYKTLRDEMQKDRARNTILPVSSLGIIEMARQRVGQDAIPQITVSCDYCEGTGRHLSPRTAASHLLDTAMTKIASHGPGRVVLRASRQVIETLGSLYPTSLKDLEERAGQPITLNAVAGFDAARFEVEHNRNNQ